MSAMKSDETRSALRFRLDQARTEFHELLGSLSDEDLKRQSKNQGWSNGEILFHIMFAFILILTLGPMIRFWSRLPKRYSKVFANILNSLTVPFNWINGFAPRMGAKVFTRSRYGKMFDNIYARLIKLLVSVKDNEWNSGMYYPDKWEPLFDEFMTLEKLFYYPIRHLAFHVGQISR
jgi:DinB superfamily